MKPRIAALSFLFLLSSCASTQEIGVQTELPQLDGAETESALPSSLENYEPLELVKSMEITPDEDYSSGAFCRVYYDENEEAFFTTFGTGMVTGEAHPESDDYVGGGEGGQGSVYKYYSTELKELGDTAYYVQGGGDLATVMVGDKFYHLTGGPTGWRLSKYDTKTWKELDRIDVELTEDEGANDQMLAYANGMLIASSGYAENAKGADTAQGADAKKDPSIGIYTHHHTFDLDLNPIDSWILEDTRHSNGSSMVFVDGIYQFVTSTAFFGDLMVMQYDEEWNYLGSKTLIKDAQWPQGAVYDEETERYYVAYLGIEGGGRSEVSLAVFDKEWTLLSNTVVTDYEKEFFGGRPSLLLHEDQVYVVYDKETLDTKTKEWNKDWQCQVSVFDALKL
jgi:hypothetical protein